MNKTPPWMFAPYSLALIDAQLSNYLQLITPTTSYCGRECPCGNKIVDDKSCEYHKP